MNTPIAIRPARPGEHQTVTDLAASAYLGEGLTPPDDDVYLRDVASRADTARQSAITTSSSWRRVTAGRQRRQGRIGACR